ncbi:MAG: hypothetical protein WDA13_03720 [Candidatus Shapirobacteria bacterium]
MKEIPVIGIDKFEISRNVFNEKTGDFEMVDSRYVRPSKELLDKIDELPINSKVGIEYYPYSDDVIQEEIQKATDDSFRRKEYWNDFFKSKWNHDEERDFYWNEIIEKCKSKKLGVVFLENCQDNKKYCEYSKKSHQYGEAWDSIEGPELGFGTYDSRIETLKETFKNDPDFFKDGYDNSSDLLMRYMSLCEYQRYIGIPNNVVKNIIEVQPDLVILSKRTLDYWVRSGGKPGTTIILQSDPKIKTVGMEIISEDGWKTESNTIRSNLVDYDYGKSGKAGEEKRKEIAYGYVKWIVSNDIQIRDI